MFKAWDIGLQSISSFKLSKTLSHNCLVCFLVFVFFFACVFYQTCEAFIEKL